MGAPQFVHTGHPEKACHSSKAVRVVLRKITGHVSQAGKELFRNLDANRIDGDASDWALVPDSYAANRRSHRLYHRLGFEIWSFHFIKPIGDWKGDGSC